MNGVTKDIFQASVVDEAAEAVDEIDAFLAGTSHCNVADRDDGV